MLEAGIRGEQSVAVTSENTAKTMGSGVHERFIINNAKFAAKAESKKG